MMTTHLGSQYQNELFHNCTKLYIDKIREYIIILLNRYMKYFPNLV